VGSIFVIFLLSTSMNYTTYFDKSVGNILLSLNLDGYINSIRIYSSLLLVFFLIFHANYMIIVYGESKKRTFQKEAGVAFGVLILINILVSYYTNVKTQKLLKDLNYTQQIKAENKLPDAYRMFYAQGVKIEYFDFNKTKVIYEPTQEDKEIRKKIVWHKDEMQRYPIYLTVAFSLMILAFYLSDFFGRKTINKKQAINKATTK